MSLVAEWEGRSHFRSSAASSSSRTRVFIKSTVKSWGQNKVSWRTFREVPRLLPCQILLTFLLLQLSFYNSRTLRLRYIRIKKSVYFTSAMYVYPLEQSFIPRCHITTYGGLFEKNECAGPMPYSNTRRRKVCNVSDVSRKQWWRLGAAPSPWWESPSPAAGRGTGTPTPRGTSACTRERGGVVLLGRVNPSGAPEFAPVASPVASPAPIFATGITLQPSLGLVQSMGDQP